MNHKYCVERVLCRLGVSRRAAFGVDLARLCRIDACAIAQSRSWLFVAQQCVTLRYDFFLADDRIIPLLPKLLGKSFFIKKRCAPQRSIACVMSAWIVGHHNGLLRVAPCLLIPSVWHGHVACRV